MNKWVSELTKDSQSKLRTKVRNVLKADYSGQELKELVQDAMNGRVSDLSDTLPLSFLKKLV